MNAPISNEKFTFSHNFMHMNPKQSQYNYEEIK